MSSLVNRSFKGSQFYTAYHFAFFRWVFGLYLLIHFTFLAPFAGEVFGAHGMLADSSLNPTSAFFPNLLSLIDGGWGPGIFVSCLSVLSFLFMVGFYRRPVAFLLWFGLACLLNRNVLISNPSIPFVGWMLLACALLPAGEPWSVGQPKKSDWQFPPILYYGAWFLLAFGYSVSGFHKLESPSWVNGTALFHLLNNPLARDSFFRELLLQLPRVFLSLLTWGTLCLEILFFPLSLFRKTRFWVWTLGVALHLGILMVVDFADLTFGMLLIHLWTFDRRWIQGKVYQKEPVLLFDGVCGLCNQFIEFVMANDHSGQFKFSPLQGQWAKDNLEDPKLAENLDTFILVGEKTEFRSTAVARVLVGLGGIWRILGTFILWVPTPIRDFVYRWVVRNRYDWFGKKEACPIPTPAERAKFYD